MYEISGYHNYDMSPCVCGKCYKCQNFRARSKDQRKSNLVLSLLKISSEQEKKGLKADHFDLIKEAHKLLIEYIDDEDIEQAFNMIQKWYT